MRFCAHTSAQPERFAPLGRDQVFRLREFERVGAAAAGVVLIGSGPC